jgi:glycosyltransferase involved in cell wall biosynthesis
MSIDLSIAAVIPCYNSTSTIEACINSVVNQSVKVDEIIVVDDGSTDGSGALVRQIFGSLAPGIKAIFKEQKNQGPSAARNNGVKASSSAYIAFLDGDDQWFPNHIKGIRQFIQNDDSYDIIATKYQSAPINYTGDITYSQLLVRNYFLTPCVVLKTKTFFECGGFNQQMRFSEDYYLWLTVMYNGKGYLLPYTGAGNIENKRPFGDKGLSSNLKQMHRGVINAYSELLASNKLSKSRYLTISLFEKIKYLRRKLLSLLR